MSTRDLKPLADDIETLLAAERIPPDPPDAARRRVRDRVEGTLGMVAVATAAGVATHTAAATTAAASAPAITAASAAAGTAGTATPAALLSLTSVKVAVVVIGAAAAVGTGAYVGSRIPTSSPPVVVAEKVAPRAARSHLPSIAAPHVSPAQVPIPMVVPPSLPAPAPIILPAPAPIAAPFAAAPQTVAPSPIAAASKRSAPPKIAPASAPAEIDDGLSAEQQLVERARASLGRGDNRQAIRLCVEHARRFPTGTLDQDREMIWIEALRAAGERDATRTHAEQYLRDFPRGMYRVKVDAVLAEIR
jgi:hypothetical protein